MVSQRDDEMIFDEKTLVGYDEISALTSAKWSISGLRNIIKAGHIPPPVHGQWHLVATIAGLFRHQDAMQARATSTLSEERLKKLRAEREIKEIELARARGDVMETGLVELTWSNIILPVRERILSMASRLAPRLEICKGQAEIESVLGKEMRDILEEMSRPVFYEKKEAPSATAPPAETQDKS